MTQEREQVNFLLYILHYITHAFDDIYSFTFHAPQKSKIRAFVKFPNGLGWGSLHYIFVKILTQLLIYYVKKKEIIVLFRVNKISEKKRGPPPPPPPPTNDNNKLMVHYGILIESSACFNIQINFKTKIEPIV